MSDNISGLYHFKGIQLPMDAFVLIVKTVWNEVIVDKLEEGCIKILETNKVNYKVVSVPGAVEIPFAVKKYWEASEKKPAAFITLGCVIRGGTPHFDYVCKAVTDGVLQLNLSLPVPVIFGVLTTDNQQQAVERTGGMHGHKGEEAAITALQMISFCNSNL